MQERKEAVEDMLPEECTFRPCLIASSGQRAGHTARSKRTEDTRSRAQDENEASLVNKPPVRHQRLPQQRSSWWNPPPLMAAPLMAAPVGSAADRCGARSASPSCSTRRYPSQAAPVPNASIAGVCLESSDEEDNVSLHRESSEQVLLTSLELEQPENSPVSKPERMDSIGRPERMESARKLEKLPSARKLERAESARCVAAPPPSPPVAHDLPSLPSNAPASPAVPPSTGTSIVLCAVQPPPSPQPPSSPPTAPPTALQTPLMQSAAPSPQAGGAIAPVAAVVAQSLSGVASPPRPSPCPSPSVPLVAAGPPVAEVVCTPAQGWRPCWNTSVVCTSPGVEAPCRPAPWSPSPRSSGTPVRVASPTNAKAIPATPCNPLVAVPAVPVASPIYVPPVMLSPGSQTAHAGSSLAATWTAVNPPHSPRLGGTPITGSKVLTSAPGSPVRSGPLRDSAGPLKDRTNAFQEKINIMGSMPVKVIKSGSSICQFASGKAMC